VKPLSRAAIIAVGSELLTPSKLDTNSLHITDQLNLLGIDVIAKAVVGDDRVELAHAIRSLLERVDLLILCGGLGPTDDDVTREAVATVLNRPLAEDETITAHLRARFKTRGFAMEMPEINRRQAMVPAGAVVIENTRGSAPGIWIDQGDRSVVLLPGPPRELKPMLATLVEGRLREGASGASLVRRVVRIVGRIESHVDEVLQPLAPTVDRSSRSWAICSWSDTCASAWRSHAPAD
jgi:nicotinamide-nucleotide amidase